MDTVTDIPVPRLIGVEGLGDLFEVLVSVGYHVIGPAVEDGVIVLRELSSAAELPFGWGVKLGFDLALTELIDERGHRFLVDISSDEGADILSRIDSERADDATVEEARSAVAAAADRMGRDMDTGGLRELIDLVARKEL